MGAIVTAFATAFRDWNTDGVPTSGAYKPIKSLLRALGGAIENGVATRAQGINEAPNTEMMVIPDLPLVRKLEFVAGVPTGALRPAATANLCTTGSNTVTIGYTAPHGFRPGELIQPPAGADANFRVSPTLKVITTPTTSSVTVNLPRNLTAPLTSSANGDWVVVTRGDTGGLTGDWAAGDDSGIYQKDSALGCWIEDDPDLLALFPRATRVTVFRKGAGSGTDEMGFFYPTGAALVDYTGARRGVGIAVACLSGGGSAAAAIYQNGVRTSSAAHSDASRGWVAHDQVVSGVAYYADGVLFSGPSGAYFAVAEFTRRFGEAPVDGEYVARFGQFRAQASITIATFLNASLTFPTSTDANGQYGWLVDMYQESGGRFGPNVRMIDWNLEGVGYDPLEILASKESVGTPITYGHVVTSAGRLTECTISSLWVDIVGAVPAHIIATVTVPEGHGQFTGIMATIYGATQAGFNGDHTVTRTSRTTFTYRFDSASNPFSPTNPGTVTTSTKLQVMLRAFTANGKTLNLNTGSFALYSVQPGSIWNNVNMDCNRGIA